MSACVFVVSAEFVGGLRLRVGGDVFVSSAFVSEYLSMVVCTCVCTWGTVSDVFLGIYVCLHMSVFVDDCV